jgi:hypothetical protein
MTTVSVGWIFCQHIVSCANKKAKEIQGDDYKGLPLNAWSTFNQFMYDVVRENTGGVPPKTTARMLRSIEWQNGSDQAEYFHRYSERVREERAKKVRPRLPVKLKLTKRPVSMVVKMMHMHIALYRSTYDTYVLSKKWDKINRKRQPLNKADEIIETLAGYYWVYRKQVLLNGEPWVEQCIIKDGGLVS